MNSEHHAAWHHHGCDVEEGLGGREPVHLVAGLLKPKRQLSPGGFITVHQVHHRAVVLRDIPGNASHPLNPSMLVKDGKHCGMDPTHAAIGPTNAILVIDS